MTPPSANSSRIARRFGRPAANPCAMHSVSQALTPLWSEVWPLTQHVLSCSSMLWRSLKYECVYLYAWSGGWEARAGIGKWTTFYNQRRPHSALGGRTPDAVYWTGNNQEQPDWQTRFVA